MIRMWEMVVVVQKKSDCTFLLNFQNIISSKIIRYMTLNRSFPNAVHGNPVKITVLFYSISG